MIIAHAASVIRGEHTVISRSRVHSSMQILRAFANIDPSI